MANCKICGHAMISGVVVHSDCLDKAIPKWISVKDRLPEDERRVIACMQYEDREKKIDTLSYLALHDPPCWQYENMGGMKVTHWMPMPELPEAE